MALFGKKKNADAQEKSAAENKSSSSISDEMKVILAAREEEQQERQARAEERQQIQEKFNKENDKLEQQVAQASKNVLSGHAKPEGMTFFVVCDEIPIGAMPEKEGNIIVRGTIRGTVRTGMEVYLYQGHGDRFCVTVEKIRNDSREFVDEAKDERAEIEITRGDIPMPTDPDEDASRPVQRFAVLTDDKGIENTKDPSSKGLAAAGNPRTIAMLCEYGKYTEENTFFGSLMDSVITAEFMTLARVGNSKNGKSQVGFMSIKTKREPNVTYLPVFTDLKLAKIAQKNTFGRNSGSNQTVPLNFAQAAAIGRDNNNQGFIINPGGPVTITIPKPLIDELVQTRTFKERFGEGAGDRVAFALGGQGNSGIDGSNAKGGPDVPGMQRIIIKNPTETPEFLEIEKTVKDFCKDHTDIEKVMILVSEPENNSADKTYLCIVDCPDRSIEAECKALADAVRPVLKEIKKVQFLHYSKLPQQDDFAKKATWLYMK